MNYTFVWIYAQEGDCWIIWQLCCCFLRNPILFSIVAAPIYMPINSVEGFLFLGKEAFSFLCFFLGICLRVGLLVLFLVFKGSSILFFMGFYQFTFPPTVQVGSFFSIPSPAFVICKFFDGGHSVVLQSMGLQKSMGLQRLGHDLVTEQQHSDQCEVILNCSFDLHFSNNQCCEHLFMCFLAIYNVFFG